MSVCLAVVTDMIFASRISAAANDAGVDCVIVRELSALLSALERAEPKAVLVDMSCDGIVPEEAIRTVKAETPESRVIAFFSHVQTELMVKATDAGADDVWPRSVFVQRLRDVLIACSRPAEIE